jgi:hypothetical protein
VPVCDLCGAPIDLEGYHVVVAGRRYDSMECALRAQERNRRRTDATSAWVSVARRRLGIANDEHATDSDQKTPSSRTDGMN